MAAAVNLAVDMVPGLGDLKGIIESIAGEGAFGEKLATWERVLGILCIAELKGIGRLGKQLDDATNATTKMSFKEALEYLNQTGLRPGQTEISRSRVIELIKNFDKGKATSSIFKSADGRFLVEGHHTTIASTMLGKSGANMGLITQQAPSVTNVFWTKNWYEFWKSAIKVKP
jgi:hypothetical protein